MDGMPTNFEPVGRGFESLRARQTFKPVMAESAIFGSTALRRAAQWLQHGL